MGTVYGYQKLALLRLRQELTVEAYPQTTLCSSLSWGCICIQIYLQVPPLFYRWRPHRPYKKVGSDGGQTPYGMANPFEVAIATGIMDPRNRRKMKFQLQILFSWSNLTNKKSVCVDYNLGTWFLQILHQFNLTWWVGWDLLKGTPGDIYNYKDGDDHQQDYPLVI